jgi:flagellar basal body P-ring formation protein FlgA
MTRAARPLALALALLLAGPAVAATLAPGEPLGRALVTSLVEDALVSAAAGERFELQLTAPALPVANLAREPGEVHLAGLDHDPASGRFQALILVEGASVPIGRVAVHGRALPLVEVAVPARLLPAGTIVGPDDLAHVWLAAGRVGPEHVGDAWDLVGAETRRPVAAGRPVRARDLGPPRLVARGRAVTMVYEADGLRIATVGRALEDGGAGDPVRIVNQDSNRQVQAVVTGPDEVRVGR